MLERGQVQSLTFVSWVYGLACRYQEQLVDFREWHWGLRRTSVHDFVKLFFQNRGIMSHNVPYLLYIQNYCNEALWTVSTLEIIRNLNWNSVWCVCVFRKRCNFHILLLQVAGHQTAFINELKLSDFKQVLNKNSIPSEFSGGVLWCCNGSIAVRRVSLRMLCYCWGLLCDNALDWLYLPQ